MLLLELDLVLLYPLALPRRQKASRLRGPTECKNMYTCSTCNELKPYEKSRANAFRILLSAISVSPCTGGCRIATRITMPYGFIYGAERRVSAREDGRRLKRSRARVHERQS